MAAYILESDTSGLDFRLVINSFVTLFWRMELLDQALGWLQGRGYTVVRLDASRWTADADLHCDIAAALDFPDYYGRNLDALNDCMRDVVDYQYGATRDATGLVLAFTGYESFAKERPRTAHTVLDIMADQARAAALIGHRVMCLVQSNDPNIAFEPVGAMSVMWNHAEWFDARRRPGSQPHPLIPSA